MKPNVETTSHLYMQHQISTSQHQQQQHQHQAQVRSSEPRPTYVTHPGLVSNRPATSGPPHPTIAANSSTYDHLIHHQSNPWLRQLDSPSVLSLALTRHHPAAMEYSQATYDAVLNARLSALQDQSNHHLAFAIMNERHQQHQHHLNDVVSPCEPTSSSSLVMQVTGNGSKQQQQLPSPTTPINPNNRSQHQQQHHHESEWQQHWHHLNKMHATNAPPLYSHPALAAAAAAAAAALHPAAAAVAAYSLTTAAAAAAAYANIPYHTLGAHHPSHHSPYSSPHPHSQLVSLSPGYHLAAAAAAASTSESIQAALAAQQQSLQHPVSGRPQLAASARYSPNNQWIPSSAGKHHLSQTTCYPLGSAPGATYQPDVAPATVPSLAPATSLLNNQRSHHDHPTALQQRLTNRQSSPSPQRYVHNTNSDQPPQQQPIMSENCAAKHQQVPRFIISDEPSKTTKDQRLRQQHQQQPPHTVESRQIQHELTRHRSTSPEVMIISCGENQNHKQINADNARNKNTATLTTRQPITTPTQNITQSVANHNNISHINNNAPSTNQQQLGRLVKNSSVVSNSTTIVAPTTPTQHAGAATQSAEKISPTTSAITPTNNQPERLSPSGGAMNKRPMELPDRNRIELNSHSNTNQINSSSTSSNTTTTSNNTSSPTNKRLKRTLRGDQTNDNGDATPTTPTDRQQLSKQQPTSILPPPTANSCNSVVDPGSNQTSGAGPSAISVGLAGPVAGAQPRTGNSRRSLAYDAKDSPEPIEPIGKKPPQSQQQPQQQQQIQQQQAAKQAITHSLAPPVKCHMCCHRIGDQDFVQCPSKPLHKFCFPCSKASIQKQQAEHQKNSRGLEPKVFCPSGEKCLLQNDNISWTFMANEIETIFRANARPASLSLISPRNERVGFETTNKDHQPAPPQSQQQSTNIPRYDVTPLKRVGRPPNAAPRTDPSGASGIRGPSLSGSNHTTTPNSNHRLDSSSGGTNSGAGGGGSSSTTTNHQTTPTTPTTTTTTPTAGSSLSSSQQRLANELHRQLDNLLLQVQVPI